jgi:hypothetical protein
MRLVENVKKEGLQTERTPESDKWKQEKRADRP